MAEQTQQHQTAPASPARWKVAGAAALGAMALAAAIIWIPYWPVQVLLGIGAAVFVYVMLRDPAYFFMRMSGIGLGAAAGVGSLPAIKAGFGLPDGTWAALVLDNSPWAAMVLAVVGLGFGVLELVHRRPPSPSLPPAPPAAPPSGPVTTYNAPVTATTHQGPVNTGTVQHQTINYVVPAPAAASAAPTKPVSPSNLPPRSPTFVPRQKITQQIHDALRGGTHTGALRQAAARAYGGYGKTVAAILYAHEYAHHYPGGRFFLSTEKQDFTTALASLGHHLGVPDDAPPPKAAALVKQALEGTPDAAGVHPASLLILDNIVDAAHWQSILAATVHGTNDPLIPRGGCRVLLTTRAESIPQAATVPMGRLTPEEAREVYRRFAQPDGAPTSEHRDAPSDATADAITALVGGLAVAVAAVAALLKLRPDLTWDGYAMALRDTPIADLPDADAEVRAEIGHGGTALDEFRRTLSVIDAALDSLPAPERRAVEYAALLPEDMVPAPWLVSLLEADAARSPVNENGGPDPLHLAFPKKPGQPPMSAAAVVRHLDMLDVLTPKDEEERILGLHRLWHARVNERSAAGRGDTAALWSAIAACASGRRADVVGVDEPSKAAAIDNPRCLTNAALRWELSPLLGVAVALAQAGRLKEAERVALWLANPLKLLGRLAEARAVLESLLKDPAAAQAALGDSRFASLLTNLALIQQALGDLPGARGSMERAIEIESKHFAPDHPTFAISYSNLAMIQQDQGDLPGARASMERAIEIESKHFAPDHPTFATRYSNLALIQQDQGDLPGARASMERAIAIGEKHLGTDHPLLATCSSNLAMIQKVQGDLPGARASMERAIEIQSKHFAPDHPTFATRYSNLATIQQDQGDLPGARGSMERAIAIGEKHLGTDHPLLATCSSNLAMIQKNQGDLPGARASMERAIEIESKHFAPDHPTFAIRYSNLATIQQDQGDLPGARGSMERAIAIGEKHLGTDHPLLATCSSNLAMIQKNQGDLPGARASMERAIEIESKHFAPDHPTFAISYNNLALICLAEGDAAGGGANFRKALSILRQHFDDTHPHIQTTLRSMRAAGCGE